MLALTIFATPMFFRHKKDSGSWSIYNTEDLFDVNCILVSAKRIQKSC
jgi:hypothetical protein